jgi:hypothetical protein
VNDVQNRGWWAVLALVMTMAGCSKNEAATKKCTSATDKSSCEACCKKNGANGYTSATVNGKYSCKCMGGG